ncbi:gamma-butyrobetaine hydroxylase-like domain-containing protein [Pseudoalteromonas aliena]|uniref:gamma-butyrobetaine hydroxylase-like domain-containing protein n=1 Tax=Pseudoalteromonas aliena TaxID=247523 RepID=UPI00311F91B2
MKHVTKVHYHSVSRNLDVYFDDDSKAVFSCEFLRVHSPSAEVQGHGTGPIKLVLNKQAVGIKNIVPVGHYALRLDFDDGHDSGLFSWRYFEKLQQQQDTLWSEYLARVTEHEESKDNVPIKFVP